MNSVVLVGSVATEPELRYTPNGKPVANFRIAIPSGRKNKDNGREYSDYFTITAWGELGERVGAGLNKGDHCFVQGRLNNESWTGQDGKKRYSVKIVASSIDMPPFEGDGEVSDPEAGGPEER